MDMFTNTRLSRLVVLTAAVFLVSTATGVLAQETEDDSDEGEELQTVGIVEFSCDPSTPLFEAFPELQSQCLSLTGGFLRDIEVVSEGFQWSGVCGDDPEYFIGIRGICGPGASPEPPLDDMD